MSTGAAAATGHPYVRPMSSTDPTRSTFLIDEHTGNYCLEYLGTRLPLEHYVVADICRLICRIVKLGWLDNSDPDVFPLRDLPSEVDRFLTGSVVVPMQLHSGIIIAHECVFLGATMHCRCEDFPVTGPRDE